MFEQAFSHRPSPLHSLDPRVRLLAAACGAVVFSCLSNMSAAWASLGFSLLLLIAANPPLRPLLKRVALVNLFILFLWLTVPLSMAGERLFSLGPLHFSASGVSLALLVTVKSNAILLLFIALVAGISVPRIGSALERLRVPGKLVFLLLFTYRYVHAVGEEWDRLRTAAKLRGFVARNSLHTYRTIGNMLGLVLINSFDRAQRVYEAMLLRGFNGSFHTVGELRTRRRDLVFALLFTFALVLILGMELCLERALP